MIFDWEEPIHRYEICMGDKRSTYEQLIIFIYEYKYIPSKKPTSQKTKIDFEGPKFTAELSLSSLSSIFIMKILDLDNEKCC